MKRNTKLRGGALVAALTVFTLFAGPSASAATQYVSGSEDCSAIQRRVAATGKAQDYVSVTAGSNSDYLSGSNGPFSLTVKAPSQSASWSVYGTPSILSAKGWCSIT